MYPAGEAVVLLDRPNWPAHRPWLIFVVLGTAAGLAWFIVTGLDSAEWPGGSSLPGFTLGVVGGLIVIFECLLWVRKKVRAWPIGSARSWLRAHIWLGLLCLPLLILHSGLRLGGPLSTTLLVLLAVVVVSGVWGLVLQNLLPRRMLDRPAESMYSQMDALTNQLLAEADRLVSATCGGKPDTLANVAGSGPEPVVVAAPRWVAARVPSAPVSDVEALAAFYREQVAPFLRQGTASNSALASASRATILFQAVRRQIPPAAHDIVNALEGFCQQRRLWDSQARVHFWLHNWLWVHFPLSVALVVLMVVHVVVALRYW